jgi:ornithine cyclodeaminase
MQHYSKGRISAAIRPEEAIPALENAFRTYSNRKVQSGLVGHLRFDDPSGDIHIKSAHLDGHNVFVVKIAGSFYENPQRGLPSSSGLMLVFDAQTGQPACLLEDEGYLTDLRTALAGAISARLIAPSGPYTLGIVGTGTQARMQAEWVPSLVEVDQILIWGRTIEKAAELVDGLRQMGRAAHVAETLEVLCDRSNLVITTTPSRQPLITRDMMRAGMRIVAIGTDAVQKSEISREALLMANLILVDSQDQCFAYGDTASILGDERFRPAAIREIGAALECPPGEIADPEAIVIADLTGLGALDAAIAELAFAKLVSDDN